jgi:hypothetical protein
MTLDTAIPYLYEHDVTRLFAGLALRARRVFGVEVERLHADTTSFSVHGQYASTASDTQMTKGAAETAPADTPTVIEVT